jgi:hypothetical protein
MRAREHYVGNLVRDNEGDFVIGVGKPEQPGGDFDGASIGPSADSLPGRKDQFDVADELGHHLHVERRTATSQAEPHPTTTAGG